MRMKKFASNFSVHVKSECGLPSKDDFKTKCKQERMFRVILIYLTIVYQLNGLCNRIFQNGLGGIRVLWENK
jgi:hypothetical protein